VITMQRAERYFPSSCRPADGATNTFNHDTFFFLAIF
jgi:hypothetical protein